MIIKAEYIKKYHKMYLSTDSILNIYPPPKKTKIKIHSQSPYIVPIDIVIVHTFKKIAIRFTFI